jgi:hypothetical protein
MGEQSDYYNELVLRYVESKGITGDYNYEKVLKKAIAWENNLEYQIEKYVS